jgi:serine/threonine-protein kinase RsbW
MSADTVVLTVPARDEYARTVRMTAGALLSRTGASVDLLDDVRMAVEEAFIYACRIGGLDERIAFEFVLSPDSLSVTVGPLAQPGADAGDDAVENYSRFILDAVCDEFGACDLEGDPYIRLLKLLPEG